MVAQEIPARNAMDAHAQDFRDDWHVAITYSESISAKTTQRAHFNRSLLKTSDVFNVCSRISCHLYTQSNKNPSSWYFVRPSQAVTCGTVPS